MKNKRFYSFMVVLYDIIDLSNYDYIYICHDKDYDDDGNLKKKHYHIIIRFKNARTISSLSKELKVGENMVEPIKSLSASLKYLLHYKNDTKYQYKFENVVSNCDLKSRLQKLIREDIPEDTKIIDIFDFISNYNGKIDLILLCRWCASKGIWDIYRRNQYTIIRLVDDHNNNLELPIIYSKTTKNS